MSEHSKHPGSNEDITKVEEFSMENQSTQNSSVSGDENNEPDNLNYQDQIDKLNEQIALLQEKFLRELADKENIRNRLKKEIEDAREYSIKNFAADLIPVIDNINRALGHLPKESINEEVKNIVSGMNMIIGEFENALSKNGVLKISPQIGSKFDYNMHQAISQFPTDTMAPGNIYSVMQDGYKIRDRLLKPAMVIVSIESN